ncbi:MAG: indolepyruvate oxidoreductase subunit beta [Lachnospiraceae bacterium]|nr:indolepyruvate oxidoreductase subunit beta [Lachnospiraceae bacterium]
MTKSIMIVGVGGQGTLLASRIIGYVLQKNGLDVKLSEVHGMSQRGGSVVTYVRFGEKVYSAVVTAGEADFILAFEKIEAARYIHCLKDGGRVIANTAEIDPMPVIIGKAEYPHGVLEELRSKSIDIDQVDAEALAKEAGSVRAANVVLVGRLSKAFDFPESDWIEAIRATVKPKFIELNEKAFQSGRN